MILYHSDLHVLSNWIYNFPRLHAMLSCLCFSFFFFFAIFIVCTELFQYLLFLCISNLNYSSKARRNAIYFIKIFWAFSWSSLIPLNIQPTRILVLITLYYISSVQFSHSVLSDALRLHGLQHMRLPCPSPNPRAYSTSCP